MSLEDRMDEETQYYDKKIREVEEEVKRLEKQVSEAEILLDQVLDEIELGENLLRKLAELTEGK
ncbi:MAG TPA: hypothetical protein VJ944_00210, partial [Thermoplasmataceae archaeon]|nr:hypothetical protein [Thermoplasmataceae archaeon]